MEAAPADLSPYDAIVLLSFGGPESPEEVLPFLQRVTAGRGIPAERLQVVGEHYYSRGGVSPINAANRALLDDLRHELAARGCDLPLFWGNRNAAPFVVDALAEAVADGATRIVTLLTSAFSSYSSCRQYREDLAAALDELGPAADGLVIDKLRPYAGHPAVLAAWVRSVRAAVEASTEPEPRVLFVTHSLPAAMDDTSGPGDGEGNLYVDQHLRLARAVTDRVGAALGRELEGELVFCSRSGRPEQPWLEPDVGDRIEELAAEGVRAVVLAPIGFVSDHMEVVEDLDTQAMARAHSAGVSAVRAATPGTDRDLVAGLVDLLVERAREARGEDVVLADAIGGDLRPSICEPGCCPNLRAARPALCGSD